MMAPKTPLISVIIPCYNQAHFLGEAIESVLVQSHSPVEIVVVDDGSTDNTAEVAARYSHVHYLRQNNQGLAAARNTGIQYSSADYLAFLDADDRLLLKALESGLKCLEDYPECAFVYGRYRLIGSDGSELSPWPQLRVENNHYAMLLQSNYIGMHATVMYRRTTFDSVGAFNTSLRACEDYDLYLRVTRQFPITCHEEVIAEYRKHEGNMTLRSDLMLSSSLAVLGTQWRYVQGNRDYEDAYRTGVKFWRGHYSRQAIGEMVVQLKRCSWSKAFRAGTAPLQYALRDGNKNGLHSLKIIPWLSAGWNRLTRLPVGRIDFGKLRCLHAIGASFDNTVMLSIDRYYLNRFLGSHSGDIRGCILELGDGGNGRQFGKGQLSVYHKPGSTSDNLKVVPLDNLSCVFDLPADSFDCLIWPSVLHPIYDVKATVQHLYRLLKAGGVILASFPGLSLNKQIDPLCWTFTSQSVQRLLAEVFPAANFSVNSYGNVLAMTAFLHGLAANQLRLEELDYQDLHYQILIGVRVVKPTDLPKAL